MPANEQLSCGIVIVAAGRGERAGSQQDSPKQYRVIGGPPVICHTLDVFASWPRQKTIVVVIHPDDEALFQQALGHLADNRTTVSLVHGGPTRQLSVLAGLKALEASRITHVMIQ